MHDEGIEREVVPWYMHRRGENPYATERADGSQDPKAFMRSLLRKGLGHAVRDDIHVTRALMRIANLLAPPEDVMRRPEVVQSVLRAYQERHNRPPRVVGPSRTEMVELLKAAS